MTEHSPPATSTPTRLLTVALGALPGLYLLITSTVHLVEGEFVYDVKRLLQLCLLLVLFLAAAIVPGIRTAFAAQLNRIPGWIKALLGVIMVLGVTSSAINATSGMHLAYSLLEVALLSMLVLGVLVIAACRVLAGELFDQVAITLFALMAVAVGIQELLGVAAALANELEFFFRISLMHYSWPRFYNQVQAWTLPVLAALPLVWSRSKSEMLRNKWFQAIVCLSALGLHWYIILMTGGRGVALSLSASFVICLLLFPATRRPTLRWHLPGCALGIALFFAILQINERVLAVDEPVQSPVVSQSSQSGQRANPADWYEKEGDEGRMSRQSLTGRLSLDSSGRTYMWRGSLNDIKAHPLLGAGPMNYACTGPMHRAGHPHSFALQFAGEWGLPATLILLGVVAALGLTLWRNLRSTDNVGMDQQSAALLATGLVSAAAYSFLSGVMVMPASQVAGLLVGGWLLGIIPTQVSSSPRSLVITRAVIATAFLISAIVTVFSVHEFGQRSYRETIIPPGDQGIPRYWQQGKICKYFDAYG